MTYCVDKLIPGSISKEYKYINGKEVLNIPLLMTYGLSELICYYKNMIGFIHF